MNSLQTQLEQSRLRETELLGALKEMQDKVLDLEKVGYRGGQGSACPTGGGGGGLILLDISNIKVCIRFTFTFNFQLGALDPVPLLYNSIYRISRYLLRFLFSIKDLQCCDKRICLLLLSLILDKDSTIKY